MHAKLAWCVHDAHHMCTGKRMLCAKYGAVRTSGPYLHHVGMLHDGTWHGYTPLHHAWTMEHGLHVQGVCTGKRTKYGAVEVLWTSKHLFGVGHEGKWVVGGPSACTWCVHLPTLNAYQCR